MKSKWILYWFLKLNSHFENSNSFKFQNEIQIFEKEIPNCCSCAWTQHPGRVISILQTRPSCVDLPSIPRAMAVWQLPQFFDVQNFAIEAWVIDIIAMKVANFMLRTVFLRKGTASRTQMISFIVKKFFIKSLHLAGKLSERILPASYSISIQHCWKWPSNDSWIISYFLNNIIFINMPQLLT